MQISYQHSVYFYHQVTSRSRCSIRVSLKLWDVGMRWVGVGMYSLQDWSINEYNIRNHIGKRKPAFHTTISIPTLPRGFIRWYLTEMIAFLVDTIHRKSPFHCAKKKINGWLYFTPYPSSDFSTNNLRQVILPSFHKSVYFCMDKILPLFSLDSSGNR